VQLNILTVDVEDYFQVQAFASVVTRSSWDQYASRIENNTLNLLDILDEHHAHGTFFILGWVAERYPGLIREIVKRGHEPACHSYWHRLIYQLECREFRDDTLQAKDVIEQAASTTVRGYRAPSFSITSRSLWALEILVEAGFSYDSSIFPGRHDIYGIPGAPRVPFRIETASGSLLEYPVTTFRCGGQNFPVGGGGYLRIPPLWYTRFGIRRLRKESVPLIAYVHPWEIDPEQPRIAASLKSRFRHYTNLNKMESRLRAVLRYNSPFSMISQRGM